MSLNIDHCPICLGRLAESSSVKGNDLFHSCNCPACGTYRIGVTDVSWVAKDQSISNRQRAALAHAMRKLNRYREYPTASNTWLHSVLDDPHLPDLWAQLANLLLWLGDQDVGPGHFVPIAQRGVVRIVGALDEEGFDFLRSHLLEQGLIEGPDVCGEDKIMLTVPGWHRYEELQKSVTATRRGFMAMPFGNAKLDRVYRECCKEACRRAGFDLVRIDENPPAGLIDDRLRVEIRNARFMIAELTDSNPGAYWESGYAEGLGRPVIYLCEKTYFADPGTHFDTEHQQTVLWELDNLTDAQDRLVATLRATFPDEAIMQDSEPPAAE